jgi:prepilin-type processing-associated H-X9-DG protein
MAWNQYADANQEILLSSAPLTSSNRNGRVAWVPGVLNAAGAVNRENWDSQVTVRRSPLARYLPAEPAIWRCPADQSQVVLEGRTVPRVRSYSMSSVFDTGHWLPAFRYRTYGKRLEIARPSQTFVLVDEHPDSINDAAFAVQMVEPAAIEGNIIDLPGSLHSGGTSFSFADGHVEIKRWSGKTIQQPVTYRGDAFLNIPARDSLPDVKWLSSNCTVRR